MTKTIGLICASLRNNSYNRIIAESLLNHWQSWMVQPISLLQKTENGYGIHPYYC